MPFVPLIVAAVSIAASAGTIGAIVGGVALSSLSIGAVAGVVGAVGATIGAVGAVTGNKALKTAGLVIGGIGAIGGLANAVGAFGEGATVGSVFGSSGAAGEAAGGGDFIGSAASQAGETTSWTGMAAPTEGSVVNTAEQIAATSGGDNYGSYLEGAPNAPESVTVSASKLVPEAGGDAAGVGELGTVAAGTAAAAATPKTTEAAATEETKAPASSINPETGEPAKLGDVYTNKDSGASFAWDGAKWTAQPAGGFMSFLKSPGGAAAVVGGLNMVSGMMDPTTASKIADLDATAHANEATAALTNKRVSNMNDVLPTARRVPVTGRLGTGMINSPVAAGVAGGVA
jgi:hypothetical protein